MSCMAYEGIIKNAFSMAFGQRITIKGDPAGLASAAAYESEKLDAVKIGTGYAMSIFTRALLTSWGNNNEEEMNRMESLISSVINATSVNAIGKLIFEFRETVIDKYFIANNGIYKMA